MHSVFSLTKYVTLSCTLIVCLAMMGCSSTQQNSSAIYPRKPSNTDGRKAGRAMLLYEQAEKDLDVNENVVVIPPEEKPATTVQSEE